MKKIINALSILMAAAMLMSFVACSSPSGSGASNGGGGGSSSSDNPFDGTTWYGNTKDGFTGEVKNDVKLLVFDKTEYNGTTLYRCSNVDHLFFGGSDNLELRKGQKLPYTVEKKSDGSYVATTQILKYSVVIPSADSTTGYISIEHNNQTLKIDINKK